MGGIALLARELGHRVTGADANVYPPMSTQLEEAGIALTEGYAPHAMDPPPDCVVVGNAMSRGNPSVEYVLDRGLRYQSGPQWLAENILMDRWVLAVAGTHGKTSTSSLLAWILEYAGLNPGFLIGGVPGNFSLSARLGDAPFFVVEADEYDTAFFDKRSKFVHYRPRTTILNNLEYDHADIFPDLAAIQTQFHHLVRIIPSTGLIVRPTVDDALDEVLSMGCWTPVETFSNTPSIEAYWSAQPRDAAGECFSVLQQEQEIAEVKWNQLGGHNVSNALAAIAAARHAGVPVSVAVEALSAFRGVKRRMELRGHVNNIDVYDDFAHHPTAIKTTMSGLRGKVGDARIIAVLEPRSNTMRLGVHSETLGASLADADQVFVLQPDNVELNIGSMQQVLGDKLQVDDTVEAIVRSVTASVSSGDRILVMSNGGFEGIHQRLLDALQSRFN